MIVTPEGLNVFPEDVERVLNAHAGVATRRSSACRTRQRRSACTPCSSLDAGVDPDAVVRGANTPARTITRRSARASVWPGHELPRTEGTRKLKRREHPRLVRPAGSRRATAAARAADTRRRADREVRRRPRRSRRDDARRAGPELARARRADGGARGAFQTHDRRGAFAGAASVGDLERSFADRGAGAARRCGTAEPVDFPSWNRSLARRSAPPREPADLDPAARARLRLARRRGPRAPRRDSRAGHLRRQSSEPHGHAGDPGGAAGRAGATASRRRWRRSSSRRTSSRTQFTPVRSGSPTA